LGAEGFGLIAVYLTLQVWFQLLDMGLTATLAREAARFRAGAMHSIRLSQLLGTLECIFLAAGAVAGIALFLGAEAIAGRWLILQGLSADRITLAIELMALCLAVRLLGELYRAAIAGFERQVWLAGANTSFGTARLLGVIPFLDLVGATPVAYFGYQLGIGVLETFGLFAMARRLVPRYPRAGRIWSLQPLREVLGFSLAMTGTSVVWVVISQIDKVLLSGMLTLADFGAFSLAVAAAASVLLATGSLADTLIPRITRLQAQGDAEAVTRLYRQVSQWTAVIACGAAALLAAQSHRLLWVWTGNDSLADAAAPILSAYAVGNAAMALAALPYYLQLAQGRLRLHLTGTGLMVAALVPAVLWATGRWGALGAAHAWLGVNTLYLLTWTPVAHRYFAPGIHRQWLWTDIAPVVVATAAAALLTRAMPWPEHRMTSGVLLLIWAVLVFVAGVAAFLTARRNVFHARAHGTSWRQMRCVATYKGDFK
jgi:O-antigen/teichoic acid export membrane protein